MFTGARFADLAVAARFTLGLPDPGLVATSVWAPIAIPARRQALSFSPTSCHRLQLCFQCVRPSTAGPADS